MQQENKKPFVNVYTNLVDSVSMAEKNRNEVELNLMKYLLSVERIVFTLPQAGDNDVLIDLVYKSDFLALMSENFCGISKYGTFESLSDYVAKRLKDMNWTFSNSAIKSLEILPKNEQEKIRGILAEYLRKNIFNLKEVPSDLRSDLDKYCTAIITLNDAIPIKNYDENIKTDSKFLTELQNDINLLPDEYNKMKYKEILGPVESKEDFDKKNIRSYFYDDEWLKRQKDVYPEHINAFLDLVNFAYNQYMGKAIADSREWVKNADGNEVNYLINLSSATDRNNMIYNQDYRNWIDSGSNLIKWFDVLESMRESREKVWIDKNVERIDLQKWICDAKNINYDHIMEHHLRYNSFSAETSNKESITAKIVNRGHHDLIWSDIN